MGKISEIKSGKRDPKRVNIYVDGKFTLAIDTEIAVKEKIRLDTELDPGRITELERSDRIQAAERIGIKRTFAAPRF